MFNTTLLSHPVYMWPMPPALVSHDPWSAMVAIGKALGWTGALSIMMMVMYYNSVLRKEYIRMIMMKHRRGVTVSVMRVGNTCKPV